MTIGFDGSRAFTPNHTGTETYSFQILKHLSKIDTTNNYIIYLRPGNVYNPSDWPGNFEFKTLSYKFLWTQFGLGLQTFIDPIDVLFVTAHTLPIMHRPGLKTVMTAHDLGAEYLPSLHQLKQRIYLNFITNYQFKSSTHLIAVSSATKKDLIRKANCDPKKITVVYEASDTSDKKPLSSSESSAILAKYKLRPHRYFFFLGTVQPRKNLSNLIHAFHQFTNRHPEFISGSKFANSLDKIPKPFDLSQDRQVRDDKMKLVISGSKGWLSDSIYELPKQLNIEDQVIFTGRISDQDARVFYHNASAFTYPSLYEGFGIPILEAFAANCPVITSNTSSMPEVAGDAAILVDPKSVPQIAAAMERVLDKGVASKLIKKGHCQLQKFSWSKAATETLKVLESL